MREEISLLDLPKSIKFSDQNQNLKISGKTHSNLLKPKANSAWGSHLVKGFSTEKKTRTKSQSQETNVSARKTISDSKKQPLACSDLSNQKNQSISYSSRVKRSLIGDFPCTAHASRVHPHHVSDSQRTKLVNSHNLFLEIDHLRNLLQQSKEKESKLQNELLEYKNNPRVSDLERELDLKRIEVENLVSRIGLLEAEKMKNSEQLACLSSTIESSEEVMRELIDNPNPNFDRNDKKKMAVQRNFEMGAVELRRMNKELQHQKRSLACRLLLAESQLAAISNTTERDMVAKAEAEASLLRVTNEDLCKQVEGLKRSRFTEFEELAYLRWVNSCLRHELRNADNLSRQPCLVDLNKALRPNSSEFSKKHGMDFSNAHVNGRGENDHESSPYFPCTSVSTEFCSSKKAGLMQKLRHWSKSGDDGQILECQHLADKDWVDTRDGGSPRRRHSISGSKGCAENLVLNKRIQSAGFIDSNGLEIGAFAHEECASIKDKLNLITQKYELGIAESPRFSVNRQEISKITALEVEKRALRIPNPPPRPSNSVPSVPQKDRNAPIPPPPPPPPPPPKFSTCSKNAMQRAPQVVEFYHSLMKRDSRKEPSGGLSDTLNTANVRSSMIGEIENRSSYLLAIKADVETQGEFVRSLIREVNNAVYRDIEDIVAFVKWLDDELCFLVDERAVLKHFEWPERKADALREAAFGYRDLKKIEFEVSFYEDDHRLPCDVALKKMLALSEKMERGVYNLLRTRDAMMAHCKEFQIPIDWMLDTGIISKIKFASVKLAKKYMKRVATELQSMGPSDKDPTLQYILLQGVRFAFRIHQFAGGFDAETMHAFEELRNLAHVGHKV